MYVTDLPLEEPVCRLLQQRSPLRVAVFLRNKCPLYPLEGQDLLVRACSTLKIDPEESRAKLLTIWKIERMTIFSFDLWNNRYDWTRAYYVVDLPVLLVDYGKRLSYVRVGSPNFREEVNTFVARQHDLHGWDARPPYVRDQTVGVPTYPNPRLMKKVQPDGSVRRAVDTPPPELGGQTEGNEETEEVR